MFARHRHDPPDKLNCPHAMGTNAVSPQWPKSFRHILLLPSPSIVYNRRKPPNLRVSVGAGAPQLQTLRLRIRSRAGACPRPAQRTATGYAGRCAEGVKARSIAAFDWRCRAFLAKGYYDFNIRNYPQFVEKLRYLHRNPVKQGLCDRARTGSGAAFATTLPALKDV